MSTSQTFISQVNTDVEKAFEKIQIIIWQQRLKSPNLQFIDDEIEMWESLLLYDGETFPGGESISGKGIPAPPFTITIPRDPNTPAYRDRVDEVYFDLLFRSNLDSDTLANRKALFRAIYRRTEGLLVWLKGLKQFMATDPRAYTTSIHDVELNEPPEPSFEEGIIESVTSILGPIESSFSAPKDYERAIRVLVSYFKGIDIHENRKIHTRGAVKGKLAFALGEIHRDCLNAHPSHRYLSFLTIAFKIFENENLDEDRAYDTRLYKYCSTKPRN
jgi:hypothetical protein